MRALTRAAIVRLVVTSIKQGFGETRVAERYAVYYAPPANGPLWERAALWLGRDARTGETLEGPVAGLERDRLLNVTSSPSRYGFHATIRAPITLRPPLGRVDLYEAVARIAATHAPVPLGPMQIAEIDGFLAIVPKQVPPAIQSSAQSCVEALEPLRAPLGERERARRMNSALSDRQRELVERYGYPFVAEEFLFHMTLTDRLDPNTVSDIRSVAESWFAPVMGELTLDSLSVFVEPKPMHAFRRLRDFPLTGAARS